MSIYAAHHHHYWTRGWRGIIPLPPSGKKPPPSGFTGYGGADPSYPDMHQWAEEGRYTVTDGDGGSHHLQVGNLALRLAADQLGADVDAYDGKPGADTLARLEAAHGPLPATWRTTSRDDGISGIRLYRVPEGLRWPNQAGPGIELIHRRHRYAVAPPSIHPTTGKPYRWINPQGVISATPPAPADLPPLPPGWVAALTGGHTADDDRPHNNPTTDDAMLWLAALPNASVAPCPTLAAAVDTAAEDMAAGGAYDTVIPAILRVVRHGAGQHHGVVTALGKLKTSYTAEVTRPGRGRRRTAREAHTEYQRGLVSAVGIVSADPGPPTCDCFGQITAAIVDTATAAAEADVIASDHPDGLTPGGDFILDSPQRPDPLWGVGDTVLWAEGEALMLVGGPGTGKTTLTGQLVRAMVGLQPRVLDMPVKPADRVLYLAMDRPAQIARSLRRQFCDADRELLNRRLVVWKGPPPADLARKPGTLLALAQLAAADTVIIDSLKDAAIGLTDDETAAGYNRARQATLAAGVQLLELHHQAKRSASGGRPKGLEDVYGSTWITAGAGSVLLLHAARAGSAAVTAIHLKQPAEEFGPHHLEHDHEGGVTGYADGNAETDPVAVAAAADYVGGVTVAAVVSILAARSEEWHELARDDLRAAKARVRVALRRAVDRRVLQVLREGDQGGQGAARETAYGPMLPPQPGPPEGGAGRPAARTHSTGQATRRSGAAER